MTEMSTLCFCFFLLLAAVPFCGSNVVGCPRDLPHSTAMKLHNGYCYQFVSVERFWDQARDFCLQYKGRLVKIDNAETNAFIVNTLNGLWWRNNGVWIGLHDNSREMQFQWTGYSKYENENLGNWNNWARGHPGAILSSVRDCVRMVRGSGDWKWHETPCNLMNWHYRFICQYKAVLQTGGQTLALTLLSPVPNRFNDSSKTSKTSKPTTPLPEETTTVTIPRTTQPESTIHVSSDILEYPLEPFHDIEEMNITSSTPRTYPEFDLWTVDEETTHDHEGFDIALKSTGDKAAQVAASGNHGRLSMIVVICLIAASFLILTAFLLQKRRKAQKVADDDYFNYAVNDYKSSDKKVKPTSSTVPNIYVINDVSNDELSRSSYLPDDVIQFSADDERVPYDLTVADHTILNEEDGKTHVEDCGMMGYDMPRPTPQVEDCGMMGYDMPRPAPQVEDCGMMGYDMPNSTHLYSEIPESCAQPEEVEDHVYESLDEVISKIIL